MEQPKTNKLYIYGRYHLCWTTINGYFSKNQTQYSQDSVDLFYCVDSQVVMSYYRLDGANWKYFSGNHTLTGLALGNHRLDLFVKTEANEHMYYANYWQTIIFSVT